jgi:hypothetical protein
MHDTKPSTLPSCDATEKEVREYIYYLLAYTGWSNILRENPEILMFVITRWQDDGVALRFTESKTIDDICPGSWKDRQGKSHIIPFIQRAQIEQYLKGLIWGLIRQETTQGERLAPWRV